VGRVPLAAANTVVAPQVGALSLRVFAGDRAGPSSWARRLGRHPSATRLGLLLGMTICGAVWGAGSEARASDIFTPSGAPVPRWVSLRSDHVNGRQWPDETAPIKWVYVRRDLPLQVIAETDRWRRVCDPEGRVAWIEQRNLSARRQAMNLTHRPMPLTRSRRPGSSVVGVLPSGAIVPLARCEAGWCRLRGPQGAGWLPLGRAWGTLDYIQCEPA